MILAGDVGATKILLEVGELRSGKWQAAHSARFAAADVADFPAVIAEFLDGWNAVKPARARITAAGIGVAGPREGNKIRMTNRPWAVDGDTLARRFAIPRVRVMNDLAASAYGIEWMAPRDFKTLLPGKPVAGDPRVVFGVGTGLGIAYLVPRAGETLVVPGEGGHMGFSPGSSAQSALFNALHRRHGRVEAEDVASGKGLANIYEALGHGALDAAEIGTGAIDRKDPDCIAAVELFIECVANVAGDHVLATVARGGVYIVGGVMAKIAPLITREKFGAAFCAKGAFSSFLMRVPVRMITSEKLALYGAARCAHKK